MTQQGIGKAVFAFRFLAEGAKSVANRVAWSVPRDDEPGDWMGSAIEGTRFGILAYRVEHLPHWLHDELYRVELRGPIQQLSTGVLARELRLCKQVQTWNEAMRQAFSHSCVEQMQRHAADVLLEHGDTPMAERIRNADPDGARGYLTEVLRAERPVQVRLALEYLNDALGAQQRGLTSCVAHICQVALSDQRLGAQAAGSELLRQITWLRERLRRVDDA